MSVPSTPEETAGPTVRSGWGLSSSASVVFSLYLSSSADWHLPAGHRGRAPWKAAQQDELTLVPANACVALDPSGLPNRWATLTGFCLFVYLFWPSLMSLPLPPSGRGSLLAQLQKLKGSDSE